MFPKCIDGLQPIPKESNDKVVAVMLDELTIEAHEESFVSVLQHGGSLQFIKFVIYTLKIKL